MELKKRKERKKKVTVPHFTRECVHPCASLGDTEIGNSSPLLNAPTLSHALSALERGRESVMKCARLLAVS